MTEKRYKLVNLNNLFKDMNIGIVESNTRMLKLIDVIELLNDLSNENKQLKKQLKKCLDAKKAYKDDWKACVSYCDTYQDEIYTYKDNIEGLKEENEQLKQHIEYLEEEIKENEWHWNTIDEDRDVWHYKCNQAEEKVKELKDENEQLKQQINDIRLDWNQDYREFNKDTLYIEDHNTKIKLKDGRLHIEVFIPKLDEYFRFNYIVTGRKLEREYNTIKGDCDE